MGGDVNLAEAKRRIAAEPAVYHDHVYGETELGGTSVMFIAPAAAAAAALGYKPELGERPLPELTAEALHRVPFIGLCGTAGLAGFKYALAHRAELVVEMDRKYQLPKLEENIQRLAALRAGLAGQGGVSPPRKLPV